MIKVKYLAEIASIYKIIASLIRISFGIMFFYFSFNLPKIISHFSEKPNKFIILNLIAGRINPEVSFKIMYIFALSLILVSILEIIFGISMLLKKRWGAVGLFITSILWIPVELIFISKFLIIHKTISIILNMIVLYLLYRIITHPNGYFKKNN
ncbi:MAG: hypothetical protein WC438_02710 [Candidatus Pacearchaeota archaeon]